METAAVDSLTRERAGFAMVVVLVTLAVGMTVGLTFLVALAPASDQSRLVDEHRRAYMIAESGLSACVAYISANDDWQDEHGLGTWVQDRPFADGLFTVVVAEDEQSAEDDVYRITAIASFERVQARAEGVFRMGKSSTPSVAVDSRVVLEDDAQFFGYGEPLEPEGQGPGGGQGGGQVGGGHTPLTEGSLSDAHIATNHTGTRRIHVTDRAILHGNAFAGHGGNAARVIKRDKQGVITGQKFVLDRVLDVSMPPFPTDMGSSQNDQNIDDDNIVTLSDDLHVDHLSIEGNAVLLIDGDVRIMADRLELDGDASIELLPGSRLRLYIRDEIEIAGSANVNVGGDPSRAMIYYAGDNEFTIEGDTVVHAHIYAPHGLLKIQDNAQVHGRYSGRELKLSNHARFHGDSGIDTDQPDAGGGLQFVRTH